MGPRDKGGGGGGGGANPSPSSSSSPSMAHPPSGQLGHGVKWALLLGGQLISLEFADKQGMTAMLGRVSAFSEGQGKKGQKAESAAEASRGYFGHNFPLTTLQEFVGLHRDSLTDAERELIGLLRQQRLLTGTGDGKKGPVGGASASKHGKKGGYLIAYLKNDYHTKLHEMRHARFYLDDAYREAVTAAWQTIPDKQRAYLTNFLSRLGYHEDVHVDEFQAFHLTEKANFWGIVVDWAFVDTTAAGMDDDAEQQQQQQQQRGGGGRSGGGGGGSGGAGRKGGRR